MQKYGELIRNLRNESGISRDVLANILLVPADKLDEIEKRYLIEHIYEENENDKLY